MITTSNVHVNYIKKKKKTLKLKYNKPINTLDLGLRNEFFINNHGVIEGPYYIEDISIDNTDYFSNERITITAVKEVYGGYIKANGDTIPNLNTWSQWATNHLKNEFAWRPSDNSLYKY